MSDLERITARRSELDALAEELAKRLQEVETDDSDPDAGPAVITSYKAARNRPLTRGQKLSNKALAAVRAPVEHGFAHLKNWRILGKVRTDPAARNRTRPHGEPLAARPTQPVGS
jgi:hypothetical protein